MNSKSNRPNDRLTPNRPAINQPSMEPSKNEGIKVDGFGQVLAMLQAADPEFRNSIIKRLSQRDPQLAIDLMRKLRAEN